MRVRDHHHRQAQGRHLGQGGRTSPTDDKVRGGQRRQHLLTQERVRPVASLAVRRERGTIGERASVPVVAGDMDDRHPLHQALQCGADGSVESADRLRPTKDQQDSFAGGDAQVHPGRLTIDGRDVADRRPSHEARPTRGRTRQTLAGRLEADRQDVSEPRRGTNGAPRDDVAVPHDDWDAQQRGGQDDRHRDVATGREDSRRPLANKKCCRLRDGYRQSEWVEHGMEVHFSGPERTGSQATQRDPGRRDERHLKAPMTAQPPQVGRVRMGAE